MKVYEGMRNPNESDAAGESLVFVDGQALPLASSLELRQHSPTGFSWGYRGSGPAQLALALLLDCLEDQSRALRLYQQFKCLVVATWPQESAWQITQGDIRRICNELETGDYSPAV